MAMVSSMTGFATAQGVCPIGALSIELRCVNSRFLDLTLRIPDDLRQVEPAVRELITKRVGRGKLECRISLGKDSSLATPHVNEQALAAVLALQNEVTALAPSARQMSVSDILHYPGVVSAPAVDAEAVAQAVLQTLDGALDTFIASREREGTALAKVIEGYCDQIVQTVNEVAEQMPALLAHIQNKLTERLDTALNTTLTDKSLLSSEEVRDRIRQEVTMYALKMDVDEEINRLLTHVKEVRRVLAAGGATGRRLDFLMQEMNREANTLGSKAAAIEMTNASLALKLCIEQMREQIQNLQ